LTSCNVRFDIAWPARNAPECAGVFAAMTDDAKESTLSESRFSDAANAAQPRDFMEQSSRSRDTENSDRMGSQGTGSAGMSGQGTGSGGMGSQGTRSSQGTGSSQMGGQGSGSSQGIGSSQTGSQRSGSSQMSGQGTGGSGQGGSGASDLGEIGQQAVSQAQEQAVKIVSQAREQVTANVKSQTARGASIATVLSSTLQDAGAQLREQDETAVATYLDQAAGQVQQISTMLENQEYGQLIGTVQGFARRQPVLFFAAAVTVGVVGARFLRSSASQGTSSQGSSQQQQRDPDAYAGLRNMQGGDESRAGGYA